MYLSDRSIFNLKHGLGWDAENNYRSRAQSFLHLFFPVWARRFVSKLPQSLEETRSGLSATFSISLWLHQSLHNVKIWFLTSQGGWGVCSPDLQSALAHHPLLCLSSPQEVMGSELPVPHQLPQLPKTHLGLRSTRLGMQKHSLTLAERKKQK